MLQQNNVRRPDESTRTIPLTNGGQVLVDADDFEMLAVLGWYGMEFRQKNGRIYTYAANCVGYKDTKRTVLMHRMLLGSPKGKLVDHKNGDTLDNRKCNLRLCSHAQNARNSKKRKGSSRFKGVNWNPRDEKWQARIQLNGRTRSLGYSKKKKKPQSTTTLPHN